jgi:phage baseplate assembly protein V
LNHDHIIRIINNAMGKFRWPFRGVLNITDGAADNQLTQISGLAGETNNAVEMMQHFGFSSSPPAGSQCVVLPLGGKTAHGIVIATENGQHRVRGLLPGEVVIYNAHGDTVRLLDEGLIEINCKNLVINASESVKINSPQIDASGNLHADGNLVAAGDVADANGKTMAGMRDVYNRHVRTPSTSM